jgi:hypothetical protein
MCVYCKQGYRGTTAYIPGGSGGMVEHYLPNTHPTKPMTSRTSPSSFSFPSRLGRHLDGLMHRPRNLQPPARAARREHDERVGRVALRQDVALLRGREDGVRSTGFQVQTGDMWILWLPFLLIPCQTFCSVSTDESHDPSYQGEPTGQMLPG